MTDRFLGSLKLDYGDFGRAGRIAILIDDVQWICETPGNEVNIIIPAGEMSDGASVPWFLWWFLPPWGSRATFPAILHDYLSLKLLDGIPYRLMNTRKKIDTQFYLGLLACRVGKWRAALAYAGVRANSICYELIGWPPQRFKVE